MGILSFFSSNYKPKDFVNKTPKQIIEEMKMDKLSNDILSHEEYNALSEETKSAIQMLLDLKKGKIEIFDKCYNKRGMARPVSTRPHLVRPVSMIRPANVKPLSARPLPIQQPQQGGKRTKRKGTKKNIGTKKRRARRSKKTRKH